MPQHRFPWRGLSGSGFGSIDYSDLSPEPLALTAKTWTPVTRTLAPSPANFNLPSAPWAGFDFWDGSLLRARAIGDLYLFNFAYKATPTIANATLRFAVQPNGAPEFVFGPGAFILDVDAGEQASGNELCFEQARSRFVADGAIILVKMSCDGTLDEFSPEITPLGHA